jgi:hypothetical protein
VLPSFLQLQRRLLSYPFTPLSINALLDVLLEVFCHLTPNPVTHIPICCLFCSTGIIAKLENNKSKFFKLFMQKDKSELWFFISVPNTSSSQNWSRHVGEKLLGSNSSRITPQHDKREIF